MTKKKNKFQPLIGTIKTLNSFQQTSMLISFQPLIGTIKTSILSDLLSKEVKVFQPLIGTIKTTSTSNKRIPNMVFQPLIGTIKTRENDKHSETKQARKVSTPYRDDKNLLLSLTSCNNAIMFQPLIGTIKTRNNKFNSKDLF